MLPDASLPWPICTEGVYLIADSEGFSLRAYRCPAGIWTAGYGETDGVGPKTVWTKEYADQRFCDSLTERTEAVKALCTVETAANQLAALVSLSYNIGVQALRTSTVMKRHNAGDFEAAARAFALWNKAKVKGKLQVLAGLTTRRVREAALYLTPEHDEQLLPMPQEVVGESSLAKSPISQGAAVTGGAGALSLLSTVQEQAGLLDGLRGTLAGFSEFVGLTPGQLLGVVLIGVAAWVWWNRKQQREQGWA
jgi:lysozyme